MFHLQNHAPNSESALRTTGGAIKSVPIHIAGVRDGNDLRLYQDGKLVSNSTATFAAASKNSPSFVTIGFSGGGTHFAGVIDEVRISKVVRYTSEFTPAVRFTPDKDTLALYHCDEGTGDILADSSGNGHHGKITGAKWVQMNPQGVVDATPVARSSSPGQWIDLFNGRNLAGWLQKGHAGWSVKSGVLTGESVGAVGWLMSEREYGDFELELEYRLPPGGNSGVFLRAPEDGQITGSQFNEIQLLDDPSPKFANVDPKGRTGALFSQLAATKAPVKAANEWRNLQLRVLGQNVIVTLDGVEVTTGPLRQGTADRGRIGLQLYSPGVAFRNIRIRE
jgi:hypothetical protein